MDYKKVVSDAIKESEKIQQESEIKKIKDIVKSYLEKITEKEKARTDISKEIDVLKDDLNDLKAGRLDKIEEKQGKDLEHDKITLIIVKRIEKGFIPMYPWRNPWIVEWNPFRWMTTESNGLTVTSSNYTNSFDSCTTTGTMFQNFTSGTYDINGKIINL